MTTTRKINNEEKILSTTDRSAPDVSQQLADACMDAINIMASPGAGKTSLILRTVEALKGEMRIAAVDGDVVPVDVEKIATQGIQVELINTGGNCHLDANMMASVMPRLDLS